VRSLLLVPADSVQTALELGPSGSAPIPDATLVDLMHTNAGGVPDPDGYATAATSIDALIGAGHRVYLHIRSPQSPDLRDQLLATLRPPADDAGVYGISVPGVIHADQLRFVDSLLEDIERRHDIEPGLTAIGLWIESAATLSRAGELAAASSRLTWLGVNATHLAMELGLDDPAPQLLDHARARTVFAAQSVGLPAIEALLPGPSATPDGERARAAESRRLGLRGGMTRHPSLIASLHDLFPKGSGD